MQRYIIVDKYRNGEMSWEMKPHDHGDIAFYAAALADKEEAVKFSKGELIEKQKYILELEAALRKTSRLYAITEEQNKIHKEINSSLTTENERLRMVLQRIKDWPYDIMGDCVYDARKDAQDALKQGKEADNG